MTTVVKALIKIVIISAINLIALDCKSVGRRVGPVDHGGSSMWRWKLFRAPLVGRSAIYALWCMSFPAAFGTHRSRKRAAGHVIAQDGMDWAL